MSATRFPEFKQVNLGGADHCGASCGWQLPLIRGRCRAQSSETARARAGGQWLLRRRVSRDNAAPLHLGLGLGYRQAAYQDASLAPQHFSRPSWSWLAGRLSAPAHELGQMPWLQRGAVVHARLPSFGGQCAKLCTLTRAKSIVEAIAAHPPRVWHLPRGWLCISRRELRRC